MASKEKKRGPYNSEVKRLDLFLAKVDEIKNARAILSSELQAYTSGMRSRERIGQHFRYLKVVIEMLEEALRLSRPLKRSQ
jgi:hypothetical protein